MAKTNGKPVSGQKRKNIRRVSQKDSGNFAILLEFIRLFSRKYFRKFKKSIKSTIKNNGKNTGKNTSKNAGTNVIKINFNSFGSYGFLIPVLSVAVLIILMAALVWGFTNKNASEVYVAENSAGIIKINKNITEESLTSAVTSKISNEIGMRIQLTDVITMKNIHASKKKIVTEDTLLSKIAALCTYRAEALAVMLEGTEVALLKNEAEYESVKERLIAPYRRENAVTIKEDFAENITTQKRYADVSEITPAEKAYERLNAKYETEITYTVKPGDVMELIARSNGTSVSAICNKNGIALEDAHKLKVGQELLIAAEKPVLSILIIEEIKYEGEAEYETITQLKPEKDSSYKNVLQKGKNGKAEITAHVTMVNGVEISREKVDKKVIVPPVNEIIEIGAN